MSIKIAAMRYGGGDMNDLLSEKDTKAVIEILARELGVPEAQLTRDAKLQEDLGADSLTLVEVIMALEDRFDVVIPDERSERVETVGDVFELLSELLQPRQT
jgi:acyl carrier protein